MFPPVSKRIFCFEYIISTVYLYTSSHSLQFIVDYTQTFINIFRDIKFLEQNLIFLRHQNLVAQLVNKFYYKPYESQSFFVDELLCRRSQNRIHVQTDSVTSALSTFADLVSWLLWGRSAFWLDRIYLFLLKL